jgi:hypothetical protein
MALPPLQRRLLIVSVACFALVFVITLVGVIRHPNQRDISMALGCVFFAILFGGMLWRDRHGNRKK